MRDNKGFTLIELLAVIVILAVIALIATPIIMNVINDSKEGSAKDAMYGYVKAVELASAQMITSTTDAPSGDNFQTKDGNIYEGSTKILEVTFKGTKPKDTTGIVKLANGNVTYAELEFDGIPVIYDGKKAEVGGSSTPTTPAKTYTVGEVVYFDPTGAVPDCASGKEWTPDNTETTCYKWNVIKDNGNNIEMLLDHNTTAHVVWNSMGTNENGPGEIYNLLYADTRYWNVETLKSADDVTRDTRDGGTYTIHYSGMRARFMSGQEIADIIGDTAWPNAGITLQIPAEFSWLYQNLSTSNTDTELVGYWTDTANSAHSSNVWLVMALRNMRSYPANRDDSYGVRPVVRVLKSNI